MKVEYLCLFEVIFPFSLTPAELNNSFVFPFTILDKLITGICTDNIVDRHKLDFYLKL